MPQECVVDTNVLQKANAPIAMKPRAASLFLRRVSLLERIHEGSLSLLISNSLLAEYKRQVLEPRNDYVRAFFELIAQPGRCVWNWRSRWSGGDRSRARDCRYPREDDHVLRTAIRPRATIIFTEEMRMLNADPCIYREFKVHIQSP